jgi:hypothetical protein
MKMIYIYVNEKVLKKTKKLYLIENKNITLLNLILKKIILILEYFL